jgi:hypothetical protein
MQFPVDWWAPSAELAAVEGLARLRNSAVTRALRLVAAIERAARALGGEARMGGRRALFLFHGRLLIQGEVQ